MPKTTSPKTTRTSRTTKTKPSSDSLYAFDAEKRAAHGVICGVDAAPCAGRSAVPPSS